MQLYGNPETVDYLQGKFVEFNISIRLHCLEVNFPLQTMIRTDSQFQHNDKLLDIVTFKISVRPLYCLNRLNRKRKADEIVDTRQQSDAQ